MIYISKWDPRVYRRPFGINCVFIDMETMKIFCTGGVAVLLRKVDRFAIEKI